LVAPSAFHISAAVRALGSPRRWLVFGVGALLLGTGIALTLAAELGPGSWQVFETGLRRITGASLGTVIVVESAVLLVLAWWLLGQRPGPGTVAVVSIVGPLIDVLLPRLPNPSATAEGVLFLVVGIVAIALGLGLYVASDLGVSPQDAVFVGLYRRFGLRPSAARLLLDGVLVGAGWAIGGRVGLGTLVLTLGMPAIIDLAVRVGEHVVGRVDR
jgi:uncharacterized membrane protein YczE